MPDLRAAYDFMQSAMSPTEKVAQDNMIRETQKPRVPPVPTLTTAEAKNADGSSYATVTVTWTPVRKDLDYIVRWKLATDTQYTYDNCRFAASATSGVHILRPLPTNVSINVAIAADYRTTGARSQFNADQTLTTAQDTVAPATPAGVSATASGATGTITVSWSANTEADLSYYIIYRGTATNPTVEYSRPNTTQFVDNNATVGTTYFYRIKAADKTGNLSAYSVNVSAKVLFIGTVNITNAIGAGIIDPGDFTNAGTASITIPVGSSIFNIVVNIQVNTLIGTSSTISVRFTFGASTNPSIVVANTFTTVSGFDFVLKSASPLTISGAQTFNVEIRDDTGDTSTYRWNSFTQGDMTTS